MFRLLALGFIVIDFFFVFVFFKFVLVATNVILAIAGETP
jgi:hypothetical protein